jgi:hypothetical protein
MDIVDKKQIRGCSVRWKMLRGSLWGPHDNRGEAREGKALVRCLGLDVPRQPQSPATTTAPKHQCATGRHCHHHLHTSPWLAQPSAGGLRARDPNQVGYCSAGRNTREQVPRLGAFPTSNLWPRQIEKSGKDEDGEESRTKQEWRWKE